MSNRMGSNGVTGVADGTEWEWPNGPGGTNNGTQWDPIIGYIHSIQGWTLFPGLLHSNGIRHLGRTCYYSNGEDD
jgi:hypothetical protein